MCLVKGLTIGRKKTQNPRFQDKTRQDGNKESIGKEKCYVYFYPHLA
jgi:hypothetical protein